MRLALAAASLLVLLAACSSSDEEECAPVGTYSMTGAVETTTCKLPPGNGAATTVQISKAPSDIADAEYVWSFAGAVGQCGLKKVPGTACKLEGRCPLTITDATTSNTQGEVLVSWSFTAGGFEGVSTLTAPPFKDNPDGCVQTAKNTATRR